MNRYAIVEDGKVINVVVSQEVLYDNWVASDTANLGDSYVDGEFIPQPSEVTE